MKDYILSTNITKEQVLSYTISFTIFVLCFSFVAFQTHGCLMKFLYKPESTSVNLKLASNEEFPSLTLCPLRRTLIAITNETLAKCGLR